MAAVGDHGRARSSQSVTDPAFLRLSLAPRGGGNCRPPLPGGAPPFCGDTQEAFGPWVYLLVRARTRGRAPRPARKRVNFELAVGGRSTFLRSPDPVCIR